MHPVAKVFATIVCAALYTCIVSVALCQVGLCPTALAGATHDAKTNEPPASHTAPLAETASDGHHKDPHHARPQLTPPVTPAEAWDLARLPLRRPLGTRSVRHASADEVGLNRDLDQYRDLRVVDGRMHATMVREQGPGCLSHMFFVPALWDIPENPDLQFPNLHVVIELDGKVVSDGPLHNFMSKSKPEAADRYFQEPFGVWDKLDGGVSWYGSACFLETFHASIQCPAPKEGEQLHHLHWMLDFVLHSSIPRGFTAGMDSLFHAHHPLRQALRKWPLGRHGDHGRSHYDVERDGMPPVPGSSAFHTLPITQWHNGTLTIDKGPSVVFSADDAAGAIAELRLKIRIQADGTRRLATLEELHEMKLRIRVDGSDAVSGTVGEFFMGSSFVNPNPEQEEPPFMFAYGLGYIPPVLYCHLPMPFWHRIEITVDASMVEGAAIRFVVGVSDVVYPRGSTGHLVMRGHGRVPLSSVNEERGYVVPLANVHGRWGHVAASFGGIFTELGPLGEKGPTFCLIEGDVLVVIDQEPGSFAPTYTTTGFEDGFDSGHNLCVQGSRAFDGTSHPSVSLRKFQNQTYGNSAAYDLAVLNPVVFSRSIGILQEVERTFLFLHPPFGGFPDPATVKSRVKRDELLLARQKKALAQSVYGRYLMYVGTEPGLTELFRATVGDNDAEAAQGVHFVGRGRSKKTTEVERFWCCSLNETLPAATPMRILGTGDRLMVELGPEEHCHGNNFVVEVLHGISETDPEAYLEVVADGVETNRMIMFPRGHGVLRSPGSELDLKLPKTPKFGTLMLRRQSVTAKLHNHGKVKQIGVVTRAGPVVLFEIAVFCEH